jgi:hypothetical protein
MLLINCQSVLVFQKGFQEKAPNEVGCRLCSWILWIGELMLRTFYWGSVTPQYLGYAGVVNRSQEVRRDVFLLFSA